MELNLATDAIALIDRPLIGLAPWLYAPKNYQQWLKLRAFLEYLNFPAYHFHMTHAVYRREIDESPLDNNGLAGRLQKDYDLTAESEFVGLLRAMRFAHEAKASLHMVTARPENPYPVTGAFARQFPDHMTPFSIRGYISYMAEFIRYARQNQGLPVRVVNLIDEPRWFFLHAANPDGAYAGSITKEALWELYPRTWDFAYTFLDAQLKERGARDGVNIQLLSDVYPYGNLPNDVARLLTTPAVTDAANGLCLVNYAGPDGADSLIGKARRDMALPNAADRRIFFKDMGGTRVENATAEQEFAFGVDSIAGTLRAFRQGVDFCAQYFFLRANSPVPHAGMFASFWNGSDYAARRPLAPLALFSKTQAPGAYRMRDRAAAGVPGVDYLGLLSNRGTAKSFYTYYFVNRSDDAHAVNFTPARSSQLHRYWLNYGHDSGRTIRAQTLAAAPSLKVALPPRSMTALTEREVTNLNWPIQG